MNKISFDFFPVWIVFAKHLGVIWNRIQIKYISLGFLKFYVQNRELFNNEKFIKKIFLEKLLLHIVFLNDEKGRTDEQWGKWGTKEEKETIKRSKYKRGCR